MTHVTDTPSTPQAWHRVLGALGIVAHSGVGYVYLAAGLVVPMPWLIGFLLLWLALLVLAIRLWRRKPLWVLAIPVVAVLLLVGGVSLGGALLGWNA